MRKTLIALASITTVLAFPAAARNANDSVTITVQTDDLDLTSVADQSRLDNRVEIAIRLASIELSIEA